MIGARWVTSGSMGLVALVGTLVFAVPAQAFAPPPGPAIAMLFEDSVGILAGAEGASVFVGPADAVAAPAEAAVWAGAFATGAAGIAASWGIQNLYSSNPDWFSAGGATPDLIPNTPGDTNVYLPSAPGDWQIRTETGLYGDPNDSVTRFLPSPSVASNPAFGTSTFQFAARFYAECKNNVTGEVAWKSQVWSDNSNWRVDRPSSFSDWIYGWGVSASTICYSTTLSNNWVPNGPYGVGPATQHEGLFAQPGLDGYDPAFTIPSIVGSVGTPGTATKGKFISETRCTQPDGTVLLFTDVVDASNGYIVPQRCQDAAPGSIQTGGTIANQPVPDGPIVPQTGWQAKPQPNYPECDPTLGKTCKFQILIDGQPCIAGVADCEGWTQIRKDSPTRVQCKWGAYLVDSANCNLLERAYNPGGAPATPGNTDGDPTTGTDLAGNPWNPPKNEPRSVPAGWPAPTGNPGTTTGTDPGTNPSPSPSPSPAPAGAPGGGPIDPSKPPTITADGGSLDLSKKFPLNVFVSLANILHVPASNVCPNWRISIPVDTPTQNLQGFDQNIVCDSSFTHAIRDQRATIFFMISVSMLMPLVRSTWRAMIPIVRL